MDMGYFVSVEGFTLIELLVVIAIIAILAALPVAWLFRMLARLHDVFSARII